MPQFLNTVLARDTTDCTGANTGGLQVAGGAYVAKRFRVDGQALFNDNTASTSTTTGAVTIPNGGLGVGGAVYAVSFNGSGSGLTAIPPAALLAGGSDGQLLAKNGTSWSWTSPLSNPMTTLGDIIIGGSGGAPARLAKGTDGQVLAMVAGAVSWQTPNAVGTSTANGTTNLDGNQKGTIQVSVTGDATINMINGGADGQRLTLELKQDASGNHTVTLGTGFAWGADITSYTPTLTALMTDYIGLVYNATASTWRIIAIAKGY